jgi:peptide/nickel transport system ATP-binding protein
MEKSPLKVDAPLLKVRDLSVAVVDDGRRILDSVSFDVFPGESIGVVGEAGSGKSVLARTLLMLPPVGTWVSEGLLELEGEDLIARTDEELRSLRGSQLGIIFSDGKRYLNPLEPVGNQIADVIRAHTSTERNSARQKAVDLLAAIGVSDAEYRARGLVQELSGGLAQRVLIAMAMAHSPRLLVADEPTTGLDVTIQKQVLDLLGQRVGEAGSSQIIITRDLGIVARYCHRLVIRRKGRIVEISDVDEFFARGPKDEYSRALLEAVMEDRGERLGDLTPNTERMREA